jgi:primosomal protein N' (replication factor Y)
MISVCKDNKWTVIGPAPSLIAKVGNKFRWQILIHGPENSEFPLPDRSNLWQKIPKN